MELSLDISFTQLVRTAPLAPPLSQAGLAAPNSVGKGMACPQEHRSSTQKAPPQTGVGPDDGVELDTATLGVNLGNRSLGVQVAASHLGPKVQKSMDGPLGTKSKSGLGHNVEKSGKASVQSGPVGGEGLG